MGFVAAMFDPRYVSVLNAIDSLESFNLGHITQMTLSASERPKLIACLPIPSFSATKQDLSIIDIDNTCIATDRRPF